MFDDCCLEQLLVSDPWFGCKKSLRISALSLSDEARDRQASLAWFMAYGLGASQGLLIGGDKKVTRKGQFSRKML